MRFGNLTLAGASLALAAVVAGCSDSATNSAPSATPQLASAVAGPGELWVCKYTVAVDDYTLSSGQNPPIGTPSAGTFTASIKSGGGTLDAAFTSGGSVHLTWPSDNNCHKVWSGSEAAVVTITETPDAGSGLAFYRIVTNGNPVSFDVPGIQTTAFSVDVPVNGTDAIEAWFKNMPVEPKEEESGCTYTQGYWKTHSTYGPAAHPDANWASVGGPDASFFGSGKSWYQVFNTPPKGNAYYVLAHQYMAAVLNTNAGASTTTTVDAAMTWAHGAFTAHPNPADSFWSTNKVSATVYASTLDNYNNGLIGPGHCGDEATR